LAPDATRSNGVEAFVKKTVKLDGRKSAMSAGKRQRESRRTQRAGPADRCTAARLSRDEWVESQRLSPLLIFAPAVQTLPRRTHSTARREAGRSGITGTPSVESGEPWPPLPCAQNVQPDKSGRQLV